MRSGLPIDEALPALREALRTHTAAVLQAPPGAGKSTVVPLALLAESWARAKRLVMLEPRRLAARAIAMRMAHTLGEAVGDTVGYRMRLDTRVSRATRVEVVTEGVLTRMLQEDPALEGIAAVIFDEFHERSLQADLGLALTLDARATLAPDVRLLVMSATLDGAAVAQLLGGAPLVSAPGRTFGVETRYAGAGLPLLPVVPGTRTPHSPERLVAQLVRRALHEERGDVLVFLPGAREIRRVQSLLEEERETSGAALLPLFGELSAEAQDAALAPGAAGTRKVVLATNIAETSLTIPGVRVVVDSGLVRRARFDPVTGMTRLETQRISRASAEQRQGRAGRIEAGVCYRAWSEGAQAMLSAFTPPEISDADLVPLALELASWGAADAGELEWLDAPPVAQLASARDLLTRLGALDEQGRISSHGREMATLGVHPRLAHMLLRARALDALPLAAQLGALLSERDLLRGGDASRDADIHTRLDVLRGEGEAPAVDRAALQRVRRAVRDLERQLTATAAKPRRVDHRLGDHRAPAPATAASVGLLLAFAYPDRIGRQRAGGEGGFTLANGRGAAFAGPQPLARQPYIVALDLDDRDRDARILLAAPLTLEELLEHFSGRLRRREAVEWSSREQAVLARRTLELDALVLEEKPLTPVPLEAARAAMLTGVRELGVAVLPWDREARDLQARIEFVRSALGGDPQALAGWPAVSDEALLESLDTWLAPWLEGITRREQLTRVPLEQALRTLLSFAQQRELEAWAPTHLTVPSGSRIRIDYQGDDAPAVAVRLQELFGLAATPRLGRSRVPITFRLLSPAQRPVQVTRDLESFWRGAYAEVRKDLRGRYPKHYWPENPLEAQPTRGTRRGR
ncbi:MAG TPA: ATP-dependent helicase HrpB [Steroidobacteraceae bacterium]|nr:ATP-dependent helicase HrpB [Steroidobacteraceae bacterium]